MRVNDLRDYMRARRVAANAWEIVRFRKTQKPGDVLTVRLRQGPQVHLRGRTHDLHIFNRIFLRDEYRLNGLGGGPWPWVVDLGANVGLFSARAAAYARTVVAYEPVPENFAQLETNLAGCNNVVAVQKAVAGNGAPLKLHRPVDPTGSGLYSAYADGDAQMQDEAIEVPTVSLDELFDRHGIDRCDLLKLDVEGAEYDILYGAGPAGLARVQRIHGEYHNVRRHDPETRIENFAAWLEERGFAVDVAPHAKKANYGLFFARRAG